MQKVVGVTLESFADPVRTALGQYSDMTDGKVAFDLDEAIKFELTPQKPNSARSSSQVKHLGETIGNLVVIAFAFEDGTGDESMFRLNDRISYGLYPREAKVMPRSKAAVDSEAHLTMASFFAYAPNEDPVMFAGSLELIAFKRPDYLSQLATLGQSFGAFSEATFGNSEASPTVTLTTATDPATGEKFGDPHAVFNSMPLVQVCGFIAVSPELAEKHAGMLPTLGAVKPALHF